ncbi:MAG: DUF1217 domain-containing protein [Pararhodobacter sp.]
MSFAPVIPLDGYVGWRFLQRTMDKQQAAHAASASAKRDEAYFKANIGSIRSAEELVKDRRLLNVALTAFGLQDDLPNRAFIQKVLESSPTEDRSFVNRLSDKRYKQLSKAFGFGEAKMPLNQLDGVSNRLLGGASRAGAQTESIQRALSQGRELAALAAEDSSEETKWLTMLGMPSLRSLFESAFQLHSSFGALDLATQVEVLQSRTEELTGSRKMAQFTDPGATETLLRRFGDANLSWNQIDGFSDKILGSFRDRSFEIAVGTQSESMRLALALGRDLGALAGQDSGDRTKWFTVLGTPSLRKVFETAFMLPTGFGAMDLDRQVDILKARTKKLTGSDSIAQFADSKKSEVLVRRFFLSEQVGEILTASANGSGALMLLQQGQSSLRAMLGR